MVTDINGRLGKQRQNHYDSVPVNGSCDSVPVNGSCDSVPAKLTVVVKAEEAAQRWS
jgi:hypothetical protein